VGCSKGSPFIVTPKLLLQKYLHWLIKKISEVIENHPKPTSKKIDH